MTGFSAKRRFFKMAAGCALLMGFFCWSSVFAQNAPVILHLDTLSNEKAEYSLFKQKWAYQNGDQIAWAQPGFNDENWPKTLTNFGAGKELAGWQGIGWFRLWVSADSALSQRTLGLRINHDGASEIYVDGKYRGGFGKVGQSAKETQITRAPFEVIPIELNDTKPHLIAIRYANYGHIFPDFVGFQTWVGEYDRLHKMTKRNYDLLNDMNICSAAQLALALLHLFLFLFYPKQRLNLYYVVFSLLFAGSNLAVCGDNITSNPLMQWWWQHIFWVCGVLGTISAWHLLYAVGHTAIPRWKAIVAIGFIMVYLVKKVIFFDSNLNDGFNILFLLILLDGLWALFGAIKRRQPYVWLIGLGMILIVLLYFFVGADVFHLWTGRAERNLAMSIGLLSFPLLFSIYLALDFARTNQELSLKLIEVEKLSEQALFQEAEKLALITQQAEKLEVTVLERTAEVQRQADQLLEMDQVKSRFFVNLTHEFRTPLTLILGPVQQLISAAESATTVMHGKMIQRHAESLLRLINQLLDLSKLEAGKMELQNTSVDVITLFKRSIASFESLATQKQLILRFDTDLPSLWIQADEDKLERILNNLLANSIKYTEDGGSIVVHLTEANHILQLSISDTGIGIAENKMPYIFDRFYQVDASDTRAQEGTGIGLAITKELINLMGGSILVTSNVGVGTKIIIRLPILPAAAEKISDSTQIPILSSDGFIIPAGMPIVDASQPVVLVVEDHADLRAFMQSVLSSSYRVLTATNGEEGIQVALSEIPDLVITDLMMPLKDGYQVCHALKQNEKTSHVPVIILTAKADMDSKLTGIDTGADAYLGKPFDQRELLALMVNLIRQRRQLREKYTKNNLWLTNSEAIPSMEQVFLDKVRYAVEEHLDDEQYSVDQLGEDIGLSRTQLHRKLKGLIGQGPGELIRIVRLQRAYELLKFKAGTVAEVGYMVGFGNPNSFSTSFSKHFGFAPSEAENH